MTELYQDQIIDLLRQHVEAGCDAVLDEAPVDHYAAAAPSAQAQNSSPPDSRAATASTMQEAMQEAPQAALSTPHPAASVPPVAPAVAQPALGETNNAAAAATAADLAKAAQDLLALQAAMQGFDGCPLKKTAKNTVFSDGVADAKIMLIGEAPGQDEDREGRPFVGRSGQLLDAMLASIGLSRDENLYIANIVPWRPPGNRTPTSDEIALCAPFIRRHIELVQPDILLLVGNISNKTLLGTETGITKLRGQWQNYLPDTANIKTLPLLHPAYVLRRPETKAAYWADLCALKQHMLNA